MPLIEIEGLEIAFQGRGSTVLALDDVSLSVERGERIGIVGESGSGKSTLALAVAGHVAGSGKRLAGSIRVGGIDVFTASPAQLRDLRGHRLGYVFQNPIATLDPTRRIGRQFFGADGRPIAAARIAELLTAVGLREPERVLQSYPHELSGGMAQRVGIAMAIEHEPELIVADEPTSALDASIRTQILDLLQELSARTHAALVIVSHDLKAVRAYCDRVAVMYAGRIVETGPTAQVFASPQHPYTAALLRAVPGAEGLGGTIRAIPGNPPVVTEKAGACAFVDRCAQAFAACRTTRPAVRHTDGRSVACLLTARQEAVA